MKDLKKLYAAHFYEASSYHAERVKLLQNPSFSTYNEDEYETCSHAAMCVEMFIAGKVLEHNPQNILPPKGKKDGRTLAALASLENNDAGKIDINALSTLQMRGASDMLRLYREEEINLFKNRNNQIDIDTVVHYARLLINSRNDVLHRHHMQMQSLSPSVAFSYFRRAADAVYGKNSTEHSYLAGTYSRKSPALAELLECYINAPFDKSNPVSINTYKKEIHKIAHIYTKLKQEKKYPRLSLTVQIVRCPKCNNHAFMMNRTEDLYTYWTGEPNNSPSVLACFNTSGASEQTLTCPACQLNWKDDVLKLYKSCQNAEQIKCISGAIEPDRLNHEFTSCFVELQQNHDS